MKAEGRFFPRKGSLLHCREAGTSSGTQRQPANRPNQTGKLWMVAGFPFVSFDFSCEADSLHLIGTYPGSSYQWGTQCLESRPGACAS